ncbi:MAG: divalent-cation tolerance protein CutA [Desulfofustis sp.]
MQQEIQPIVVYTSCDDKDVCARIARFVLEKRLAACVQLTAPMTSFYWWKDDIARDEEYLLALKSHRHLFDQLAAAIRSIHPYEVPEIIATEIIEIDSGYAAWMREELSHG